MLNPRRTRQDIERMIHEEIRHILAEHEITLDDIVKDDTLHADLGLGSLDLAQLVAILEMKLQVDPFEHMVAITDVRTVGDLCQAYARMLYEQSHDAAANEALLASQKRAQARRDSRRV